MEAFAKYLSSSFGDVAAIRFILWANVGLALVLVYAFFFKEAAAAYQRYYEYKLEKCADIAQAVAQIANSDGEELKKALKRFDELYYGHLILFESRDLAAQMVHFREQFAVQDSDLVVTKVIEKRSMAPVEIRQAALKVSSQCRKEVRPTLFDLIYDRVFPVRQ